MRTKHGVKAAPIYDPTSPSGQYGLKAGTLGHDDGVLLPGFNDRHAGKGPDRGAQERDRPPLEFGVPGP